MDLIQRTISLPMSSFLLLLCVSILPFLGLATDDTLCQPKSCRRNGPSIRFPFRLPNQPIYCGYPGFDLICNQNQETILQLPSSVNVSISRINYASQTLRFYDPERCFASKLQYLNLSSSRFNFHAQLADYVLFNCSSTPERASGLDTIPCLGGNSYQIIPIQSDSNTDVLSLTNCTRIVEIFSVPLFMLSRQNNMQLNWNEPNCIDCEVRRQFCRLSNSTSTTGDNQIVCIAQPATGNHRAALIAGVTLGSLGFVALVVALYFVYRRIKTDKKIEKFLQDYKALKPTRFSYADIKRITKDFGEKLGEGGYGVVYKGKLSKEIFVAVKLLNTAKGNGEEFINEVSTIGSIHHVNVVRLVGFCADGFRRALVYDYLPNDSLDKFIFQDGPKKDSLSWDKIQEISLGIAKGIEYLHQGCDQQILHFDIKPHNILLDQNFHPKICDFGLAKFCSKDQSAVSMTDARGTMGYIAPEMMSRTFGKVSYKSDVYSFGMLLLEMVRGRTENVESNMMNNSQVYFPKWVYGHLSRGEVISTKEDESGEESEKVARKLTVAGLWCIQWYPADRPSMKGVVQMLEGDGDTLEFPPNPFPGANVVSSIEGFNGKIYQSELAAVPELGDMLV